MKNIRVFYPKNFILLVVKCSVYLNRLVFVMLRYFRAPSLSTYDFFIFYITLPRKLIKRKCLDLIENSFIRENSLYLHHENMPISF